MLASHFFWGGLYIAAASGDITPQERGHLVSVAPPDTDVDAALREATETPTACRQRFIDGFRNRRRKFTAIELHRIIYGLLDIASVDGTVHEAEVVRLRELTGLLGIPENGCDLVVNQYRKDSGHEG
jgi:tellurite resistance protein